MKKILLEENSKGLDIGLWVAKLGLALEAGEAKFLVFAN